MNTIAQLYGKVDNLECFVHPEYGRSFSHLSDEGVIRLAEKIARGIRESGRRQIVVSETGARPLAYVCERILEQQGYNVNWTYMKFPREPKANIFPIVMHYLNGGEKEIKQHLLRQQSESISLPSSKKKPLEKILQEIGRSSQDDTQKRISSVLKGTQIAEALSKPFLFFDEYIDSGTTLQNYTMYFNYFTDRLDFKTISYFMELEDADRFERVQLSVYDGSRRLECFSQGAYPFENRLDLIGYFYYMDEDSYAKVTLENIKRRFAEEQQISPERLLVEIDLAIDTHNLLQAYKNDFTVPAVRGYMEKKHLIRQFLMVLEEETHGKGLYSEFLWQLADMYGPAWTPMPKKNHFDFFDGTEKSEELIKNASGFDMLKKSYCEGRPTILRQAANACLERKDAWFARIDKLLGEENGYK